MIKFESYSKQLMWLVAFLLTAFVAGCGSGGGQDPILGIGGAGVGAAPGAGGGGGAPGTCAAGNLPLGTAANFAVLAGTAFTLATPFRRRSPVISARRR